MCVALRKESVDRNFCRAAHQAVVDESLSARRAWIEISAASAPDFRVVVALRKESVDRNPRVAEGCAWKQGVALRKESVDRNKDTFTPYWAFYVALRKESVDRNFGAFGVAAIRLRRSPQGERG